VVHTEQRVSLDDGAQTILERWGSAGPIILCIHGMTSSRKSWERLAEHYAGNARVYAYDQRGHGDSAGVTGPMTLHRALLDLYNVMDALPDPVDTLIGHSWGGVVITEVGADPKVAGDESPIGKHLYVEPSSRGGAPLDLEIVGGVPAANGHRYWNRTLGLAVVVELIFSRIFAGRHPPDQGAHHPHSALKLGMQVLQQI